MVGQKWWFVAPLFLTFTENLRGWAKNVHHPSTARLEFTDHSITRVKFTSWTHTNYAYLNKDLTL